jgi:quercetin dioxygenase-like cupin family protein
MKRTTILVSAIFAAGIAAGAFGIPILDAYLEQVKRTTLLKTDLAGVEGHEGGMWLIEIASGAATGKHYHPVHEFIYVLEGAGQFEAEGKPPVIVQAGTAMYVPPGQVHNTRNPSGDTVTRAVVVHFGEKGQPLVIPVP